MVRVVPQSISECRDSLRSGGFGGRNRAVEERRGRFRGLRRDDRFRRILRSGAFNFRRFPTVLGGVVPAYSIFPVRSRPLRFTPEILAGIYLGTIRRWNDARIREVNAGAALPDREIIVIHRADGSGTSYVWTSYLSQVSSDWKAAVGMSSSPNGSWARAPREMRA